MRALAALIAIAALGATATAPASASIATDWGRYAAWAAEFATPLPEAYIHRGPCPVYEAPAPCANSETIDIWIPDDSDRFTLAHELGHQFDRQYLTDIDRSWLRHVMLGPDGDWSGPSGAGEWFADYYADCAIGLGHRSLEGYASRPTPRRLRRVCNAVGIWALIRG